MADIKTRDAVKGTIKTIDKAAIASERMKAAYAKTKDKAEQGYYVDESSATEYASDKVSYTAERVTEEGVHQFNKQGQKGVQTTKENIVKAKDKIADFKTKRAVKAAEQKQAQAASEQVGSAVRRGAESRSAVPDMPVQTIKTKRQTEKTIKQSVRSTGKTVKTAAKGTVKSAEKSVKTAQATSKAAIKTTETSVKTAQAAAKASVKATQRAAQAAKATAKATAEATKAAVRATIAAVKAIIAGTKALISAIIAGGWVAVVIILIIVLFGCAVSLFGGGGNSNSYTPVSAEVEAYEPLIQQYARQHGIPEYTELIKAVMMQESGGRGNDPMQASECGYNTRYPNTPNGITDPKYSINVGIQNLAACLSAAEVENPIDMEHIKLALQGYNFGNGYISWAKTNYGGYSYANAVEFSTTQAERLGWDSYGDTQYVSHVLRYYPYGRAFTGGGNQAIVEVALTQLGNEGGQPYWSWYGFEGRVEWCACFVSWCANECGYIDTGVIPKFAGCVLGSQWFMDRGQWQDGSFEPSAGHIIFFDWEGDGVTDHVGIVERAENGTVYTVEGISGDTCRQNRYATLVTVNNASIELKRGNSYAIVGKSGSGKTSLISIIGLLNRSYKGEYLYDGVSVSALTDRELSMLRANNIGFVFQNYSLIKHLRVWENIELPLLYAKKNMDRKQRQEVIRNLLKSVGLEDKENDYPANLSGGEQQRVAIARALTVSPEAILCDEPTGALDKKTGQQIMELLLQIVRENNIMLLLVTHDSDIANTCDTIFEMDEGRLRCAKNDF